MQTNFFDFNFYKIYFSWNTFIIFQIIIVNKNLNIKCDRIIII